MESSLVKHILPDEFEQKLQTTPDAILIDVRTRAEYEEFKIPKAMRIDISEENFLEQVSQVATLETPCFLYCQSGGRSSHAAFVLTQNHFSQVYNLKTGIIGWVMSNKPIETSN